MMKRLQRSAVLLSLIEDLKERGSWCGETHIQKATYFLQKLVGVPLEYNFILYKHGPFSFDLSDEIVFLRASSVLILQPKEYPYGPAILPGEVSDQVKKLYPKTINKFESQIEFIANKLGNRKVAELECLATALYVKLEEDSNKTQNDWAERITQIKPHVKFNVALDAVKQVEELFKESQSILIAPLDSVAT